MSSRYPYPEDEFDTLGADRTPQGVHRAPMPRWRQWLPFLIVLVLAPTLAFVAVQALTRDGSGGSASETTTEAVTEPTGGEEPTDGAEEPTDGTEEPTDGAEETSDATEEPTDALEDLDQGVLVVVLNGSGIAGRAAEVSEGLGDLGWTNTRADNYGNAQPTVSTVYYDNAGQSAEAEAIAAELGIENLVESSSAAQGAIVIVIRSDLQWPDTA